SCISCAAAKITVKSPTRSRSTLAAQAKSRLAGRTTSPNAAFLRTNSFRQTPEDVGQAAPALHSSAIFEENARDVPIAADVLVGDDVLIFHPDLVNLYGCRVGSATKIGAFVEIQKGAVIGARCKISSHTFVCEGVTIEDEVFVGHGVMFINDRYPRATT